MLDSPIKWVGGKMKQRKMIVDVFPSHVCYVEVFGGAGWVLFGKEPSSVEVYNDLNGELYNFFEVVKNNPDEFIETFDLVLYSRDYFYKLRDRRNVPRDKITMAHDFYYLLYNFFGAKMDRKNSWGYSCKAKPKNFSEIEPGIRKAHSRLSDVYIENKSFDDIIPRYDSPETLFFCDPPYYETSGYIIEFTNKDHEKLCDVLKSIKGKFLLTINDHEYIRKLYAGFNVKPIEVTYVVSRQAEARKKYGELIITNYDPTKKQISLLDFMQTDDDIDFSMP